MSARAQGSPGDTTLAPIRLLSLDGGGIRGLSSLIILRHLMKRVDPSNPPKPCDFFDLIGGTSTGGLIAIMLGRFRMGVDECIEKYMDLSSEVFKLKRDKRNLLGRAKDTWKAEGKYRSESLTLQFKAVAKELEGDENAVLLDQNGPCKVFVCAQAKAYNTPARLRSYVTPQTVDHLSTTKCTIWQAARATSAASKIFDPIDIGMQTYVDGATGCNNPVEEVLKEAKYIWGDLASHVQCLVSIGTGKADLRHFGDDLRQIIKTLVAIATETEVTEKRFYENHVDLGLGGRYFRFNVTQGLGTVRLGGTEKRGDIEAATQFYLEDHRVQQDVTQFVESKLPQKVQPELVSETKKNQYLEWLPCLDFGRFHNAAVSHRSDKRTGGWFLDHDFERWKIKRNSFVWLQGRAGTGKTILCSSIIEEIRHQRLGALASFYFSFERPTDIDAYGLLCAITTTVLKDIVRECSTQRGSFLVPVAFRDLHRSYHPSREPRTSDLKPVLWELLRQAGDIYIVIDGLDESPFKIQEEVLNLLEEITEKSPGNTHVLVSSRPEIDIQRMFSDFSVQVTTISVNAANVNHDINLHLRNIIHQGPYKRWTENLRSQVIDHLTTHANGVFRWADLQIQALAQEDREKDVRRALKRLPKDLQKTYERMLCAIEESNKAEETLMIFRWLAYSRRPLTLAEIAELAAFEVDVADVPPEAEDFEIEFNPGDRFPNLSSVRRLVTGLVVFEDKNSADEKPLIGSGNYDAGSHGSEDDCMNGEDGYCPDAQVRFAHFSVLEYLESKNLPLKNFGLQAIDGHWLILKSSLSYLSHYESVHSRTNKSPPYPLLIYALHNWQWHVARLEGHGVGTKLNGGGTSAIGAQISGICRRFFNTSLLSEENTVEATDGSEIPSFWTSEFSLDAIEIPGFGSFENSLHVAAALGDLAALELLLDAGPGFTGSYSKLDFDHQTPLHAAAQKRNFLSKFRNATESLALWATSRRITSDKPVVQLLLKAGFRPNHQDRWGRTPLQYAAGWGNLTVVEALLEDSEIDVNLSDSVGQVPLSIAAEGGHVDIVRILLRNKEIAADRADDNGQTPLSKASIRGHKDIARLLLGRRDVDPNAMDSNGHSPFALAASLGNESVVALILLDPRTDLHSRDILGRTALALAVSRGHEGVFHMVRARDRTGASFRDNEGLSLLDYAINRGCQSIVQQLLTQGSEDVEVEAEREDGCTYKSEVYFNGHEQEATSTRQLESGSAQAMRDNSTLPGSDAAMQLVVVAELCHDHPHKLEFSNDGRRLLSHGGRSAVVWDVHSLNALLRVNFQQVHYTTALSPDGSRLATYDDDLKLSLWDIDNGLLMKTLHLYPRHISRYPRCAWAPDGRSIILGTFCKPCLWHWNVTTDEFYPWRNLQHRATSLQNSRDGEHIVVVDRSSMYVYTKDQELCFRKDFAGRFDVGIISITRDSRHILLADGPHSLALIDIASGSTLQTFYHGERGPAYNCVCGRFWGAQEEFIIGGSLDHDFGIWNIATGHLLANADAGGNQFFDGCIEVIPNPTKHDLLASYGDDSKVKMYVQ
ncbi:Fc.00g093010.m01.CDS01 [Cosmosporella sp. VM-42]